MNPGTLPLWLAGLFWLFGSRDGRRYRVIGIIYLVTLAEFIVLHGKSYYLAPAYPMLFAAGGVAIERSFRRPPHMAQASVARHDPCGRSVICASDRADLAARQTCRLHASDSL